MTLFNGTTFSLMSRTRQKTQKKQPKREKGVQHKSTSDLAVSGYSSVHRSAVSSDDRRKVLPEKLLSNNVLHLQCESSSAKSGFCDVYVVGTCHISKESCREVQNVIRYLKPQVGYLEVRESEASVVLDPRKQLTLPLPPLSVMEHTVDIISYCLKMESTQDVFWNLEAILIDKLADILEVNGGDEFYVASKEIKKYGGKIIHGDRPDEITEGRGWAKLTLWHKLKLMYCLVYTILLHNPSAKDLDGEVNQDREYGYENVEMDEEFPAYKEEYPVYYEIVVDERDQYMSSLLHKTASEHSSVVAVVGRGHLKGIKKYWKQPIDMDELMKVPPPKEGIFAAESLISSLVFRIATSSVALVLGIYYLSKQTRYFFCKETLN